MSRPTASKPLIRRNGRFPSLGMLVEHWRSESPLDSEDSELIKEVDEWRRIRNEAIHAIVKFEPGETDQSIDLFLERAKKAAEKGEKLTKAVCSWCKKKRRKP